MAERRRILDVGSGHQPNPQATLLADLYVHNTPHQSGKLVTDGRPFICCSVEYLPFKTQSITFIICSHVIEHTDKPERAIQELKRVGKKGSIQYPSKIWELFFQRNEPTHAWISDSKGGLNPISKYWFIKRTIGNLWKIHGGIHLRARLLPILHHIKEKRILW